LEPGLTAGLAASFIMLVVMSVFRLAWQVPSLPEMLADWFTLVLPLSVFAFLLGVLDGLAKAFLLSGLLAAQVVLGLLLGLVYAHLWGPRGRLAGGGRALSNSWVGGLIMALFLWLLAILVVMPAAGEGLLGAASERGPLVMTLTTLVDSLGFGLVLAAFYRGLVSYRAHHGEGFVPIDVGRRALVLKLAIIPLALLAGGTAWQLLGSGVRRGFPAGRARKAGYPEEVTSNDLFYTVSKNFKDPVIDARGWSLEVQGLVARPLRLTYDDLKAFPSVEQIHTLICISNEVGGGQIGNAVWRGVRLRDILAKAGAKQAKKVVLRAWDGYSDSIPQEKALEEGTVLAYQMNGETLPPGHGFPARLLVPGIYGMKNVKWLTAIELVEGDYQGYWQRRGWSDLAVIRTMSRIDIPEQGEVLPLAPVTLAGIAFAGERGIARVEVSADGRKTWLRMKVKPALSPYAWSLWSGRWQPPGPGSYTLEVRAWDKEGNLQEAAWRSPLPDGASGYHWLPISVS
jgi:DMSO/TMAO reductase YedYZ molybdopterin-dependent catalytic subunit